MGQGHGFPALAVEADLSSGQSWEQGWVIYADLLDKLFAGQPVFRVDLILHRGAETEFYSWNRNAWAVRSYALTRGIRLEPATLHAAGSYFRYRQAP
ncbi:MAG TPA: hypothetical protein VGK74_14130 [Symbiobacteriaceae bacterium]